MPHSIFVTVITIVLAGFAWARCWAQTLDIYIIDVEGGNATLFVSPSRESLLIDTGYRGTPAPRDAGRILAAVKDAGVQQIDHLITTHWHGDHFGGMEELAARVPIRHFIDHGPSVQQNPAVSEFLQTTYPKLYSAAKHTVAKPGDRIMFGGTELQVLTSAGQVIQTALPGAGAPNPFCAGLTQRTAEGENPQSVGSIITHGRFRALHLGDLTRDKEFDLVCPNNRIGAVDLFIASGHGGAGANSEALVHAIQPRVAVVNNGPRKGGQPEAMKILHSAPRLQDVWQLHFSLLSGQEHSAPGLFIANWTDEQESTLPIAPAAEPAQGQPAPPPPAHEGTAHWIRISAQTDGTFTVTNSRNHFSKTYRPAQ